MINFDEEIKNFTNIAEVDRVEEIITEHDVKDMTDAFVSLMDENKQLNNKLQQQMQMQINTIPFVPIQ